MKSDLFPALEDIVFAEKTPEDIEREIINTYENLSGRTLARGDPVRLFLETIILIIIHQRSLIDYSAKQNLLAYAEGEHLDHLGALLEVVRLPASKATTTLSFTLSETQENSVIIPEGTRVTPDGTILFATTEILEIPAGEKIGLVYAECTEAGEIGNGFLAGQIKRLVDPFPYEMSVQNITVSHDGSDIENDENFRERIQIATESFSVAGPSGAYKYYAMSAHQDIIDVATNEFDAAYLIETAGRVNIYILMKDGELPSEEILAKVLEICNADDVRPLTDYITVNAPGIMNYDLNVKYFIDRAKATQSTQIQEAVENAINDWIKWERSKLGRDLNPSELNRRILNAGAKRAEIISPEFQTLLYNTIAIPSTTTIIFGGLEDG